MKTVFRLAVLLLAAVMTADAQPIAQVELDNDAFNFWQAPPSRADREYTQGMRVALAVPARRNPLAPLLGGGSVCSRSDCLVSLLAVSQAIYTPNLVARSRAAGERPFAGWLALELGARRERPAAIDETTIAVGITGPASLAGSLQRTLHSQFNFRTPQGWEGQLPNELAVTLRYAGARELLRGRQTHRQTQLALAPVWAVQLGTRATDAMLGLQSTIGLRPPLPWRPTHTDRNDRWGLYLSAGASGTAVFHNLVLDGTVFRASAAVPKRLLVPEMQFGFGVRGSRGSAEWRVHRLGREYDSQPQPHTYSSFVFTLR